MRSMIVRASSWYITVKHCVMTEMCYIISLKVGSILYEQVYALLSAAEILKSKEFLWVDRHNEIR